MRDDTDTEATTSKAGHHAGQDHPAHRPFHWKRDELLTLAIGLALLIVWIGATALFGFAGLISIALILVVTSFVLLVYISRG